MINSQLAQAASAYLDEPGADQPWLEARTAASISAYVRNHRELVVACPRAHDQIDRELGRALAAQLQYAVYLTEHSIID